jgi:Putative peptidoglycan binding domain
MHVKYLCCALVALLLPVIAQTQVADKFVASLNADERKDLRALQDDWTKHEKMPDFSSYQAKSLVVSQMVLGTLGYGTKFTGVADAQTKEAIAAYQSSREIAPSGVLDAETFWSLTRDGDWVDERVTSMIPFDLYWQDDSITANGVWDRMNDKATYLESTNIECDRAKGKCIEADAMLSFNVLVAKQTEFEVTKWDEYEVVAEDSTPACERDELRINHQEKSVTVISTPTYKNESCAKALGKPETVTYRLVSGTEIAADRSRTLQLHRKALYLLTADARAIMDKKN